MDRLPRRKNSWGGYTIIEVKSREEALEWAKRFPNPRGEGNDAEIEVRPIKVLEDFGDSEAIKRFRGLVDLDEKVR